MAEKKRRGGGGKLARTENVQVRLDPKLRFAAELAAGKERRTLSSFIEWALERAVKDVSVTLAQNEETHVSAYQVVSDVWDIDEPDRFLNMAWLYPGLLTHNEQRRWKFIIEKPELWQVVQINENEPIAGAGYVGEVSITSDSIFRKEINRPLLRASWELIENHLFHGDDFDHKTFETLQKQYPPMASPVSYIEHLNTARLLQSQLELGHELAAGRKTLPELPEELGGPNGA